MVSQQREEKRGLAQGFINLRIDCNVAYIGTVSGNRLGRGQKAVGEGSAAAASQTSRNAGLAWLAHPALGWGKEGSSGSAWSSEKVPSCQKHG